MLDLLAALDPELVFPTREIPEVSWFHAVLSHPLVKSLLPLPILAAIAWPIWRFFRQTWKELDQEARALREAAGDKTDYRPVACLVIVAIVLTLQEYYGGRQFYDQVLRPWLTDLEPHHTWLKLKKYDEYYGYCWWSFSRVAGYVFFPFALWKILFREDSLLDMGLRTKGFFKHAWIYGMCLAVVVPAMLVVAQQPDFGNYYPFYKQASRSWWDFLIWEVIYFAQFLALEMFFRGFILGALKRTMGFAAIFVMAVPYCMIHYGKPYLEAHGAIVAGVVLGSLAMRTRSIYSGFLLHITVAFLMDFLSLYKRGVLPTTFWAGG
ncbi:MAG: CPBP family intramembrane metalloprotease [Polyangiaceae bacterium]|nr:CPBP family intramembrane metalloprotease [Polyangiaceae bacterium]